MYMRMEQVLALSATAKPQADVLVIAKPPTTLGRNGDFRFMMLLGVPGSRLLCPAPLDTCTMQALGKPTC